MNSSKLSAFCDRVLEAGWLLGVTITPVFFNVYSSRVFEPDKLTTMRALATVMAVFWLVRFLEEAFQHQKPLRFSWKTPLVLPALVTMGVYLITSIFSLVPLALFHIYRQQIGDNKAFLAAFFFMAVPTFSLEMIALAKQQIAELFFALFLLLLVAVPWVSKPGSVICWQRIRCSRFRTILIVFMTSTSISVRKRLVVVRVLVVEAVDATKKDNKETGYCILCFTAGSSVRC